MNANLNLGKRLRAMFSTGMATAMVAGALAGGTIVHLSSPNSFNYDHCEDMSYRLIAVTYDTSVDLERAFATEETKRRIANNCFDILNVEMN